MYKPVLGFTEVIGKQSQAGLSSHRKRAWKSLMAAIPAQTELPAHLLRPSPSYHSPRTPMGPNPPYLPQKGAAEVFLNTDMEIRMWLLQRQTCCPGGA